MLNKKSILGLILLAWLLTPHQTRADYFFNPHFILTDEEINDYQSLSLLAIQRFLDEQGSGLGHKFFNDANGEFKQASQIIWQASQEYRINPKVILATLQKEQGLINTPQPSSNQLDKAMGYRCPDDGSCHANALGFGKQVDGATWQFRQYLDNPAAWNYQVGGTYEIDGFLISPLSQATAALYNYTPHYSGSQRFWKIWLDYWGKNYPDGSLVKTSDRPGVWLIQYGGRRLITSYGVLISRFDPKKILNISPNDLEKYEIGPALKFYNHSLLRTADGAIYFLADDQLRHVDSMEVFRLIGFNPEEVVPVVQDELAGYGVGSAITLGSIYPTGALLQDKQSGGVYYVEEGIKHPIYSREIMRVNYSGRSLIVVSPEELNQYQGGEPVKFKDGELVKAQDDSRVYVIANGQRHWIPSEEAFAKFGYRWDNIVVTSAQAVDIHPAGEDIE